MMRSLSHSEIDFDQYRKCLAMSCQNVDYALPEFLDIVTGKKWFLLVKGDYDAVMPVAYTRKMGFKIILMPKLCQQLGIFSAEDDQDLNLQFYKYLKKNYLIAVYCFNQYNTFPADLKRKTSYLIKADHYSRIRERYSVHRRRNIRVNDDLRKRINFRKSLKESDFVFFSKNIRGTSKEKDNRDYFELAQKLLEHKMGILRVLEYDGEIQSWAYLYEGKQRFYLSLFVNSYPLSNPNLPSIMIDHCLQNVIESKAFDFMGSDVPTVADFNARFGAEAYKYMLISNSKKDLIINFFRK